MKEKKTIGSYDGAQSVGRIGLPRDSVRNRPRFVSRVKPGASPCTDFSCGPATGTVKGK